MTYEICSVLCGGDGPKLAGNPSVRIFDNRENLYSPCKIYQTMLNRCQEEIIMYVHDDVELLDECQPEGWAKHLSDCFKDLIHKGDSNVVAVGLGGATGLGNRDLYRKPYNIWNMARSGYASNQSNAEVHGERYTGIRRVAVLDAFFMAIRVDWLRSIGGWPTEHLTHHCMDLWLACEAARAGKEIWMNGLKCMHHGGTTSTTALYGGASWLQGGTCIKDHQTPHYWLFQNYRDVLPIQVKG
jgi:hypothetical protein